jgi:hypothetical protein
LPPLVQRYAHGHDLLTARGRGGAGTGLNTRRLAYARKTVCTISTLRKDWARYRGDVSCRRLPVLQVLRSLGRPSPSVRCDLARSETALIRRARAVQIPARSPSLVLTAAGYCPITVVRHEIQDTTRVASTEDA